MSTIRELVRKSHENAVKKGFYETVSSALLALREDGWPEEFKAAQDAFIAQRLMLITSELGEALEALRHKRRADPERLKTLDNLILSDNFKTLFEHYIKDTVEDELADAAIRLFDLAGYLDIDLEAHIVAKANYNSLRSKMHGGKSF